MPEVEIAARNGLRLAASVVCVAVLTARRGAVSTETQATEETKGTPQWAGPTSPRTSHSGTTGTSGSGCVPRLHFPDARVLPVPMCRTARGRKGDVQIHLPERLIVRRASNTRRSGEARGPAVEPGLSPDRVRPRGTEVHASTQCAGLDSCVIVRFSSLSLARRRSRRAPCTPHVSSGQRAHDWCRRPPRSGNCQAQCASLPIYRYRT